jgi:hypothetical protein
VSRRNYNSFKRKISLKNVEMFRNRNKIVLISKRPRGQFLDSVALNFFASIADQRLVRDQISCLDRFS